METWICTDYGEVTVQLIMDKNCTICTLFGMHTAIYVPTEELIKSTSNIIKGF